MSTRPVRLAPVFRSETQLGVLAATYLEPGRRFSIPELMARVDKPQSTVAREVERLAVAGWLETELVQGRRSVWADPANLIFDDLRGILLKTVGPKPVLERVLAELPGLTAAYIYGSWARRLAGEPGPLPQDIDVLLVGDVDPDVARERVIEAERQVFREVNPTVVSAGEWNDPSSGFLRHVKSDEPVRLTVALAR